jgi:hypothetical protein
MTEAIKGVIWFKGNHQIDGKKVYKYLIGAILVSDEPIRGIKDGSDHIIAEQIEGENDLTAIFSRMEKYEPPHKLGDLSNAILDISEMDPTDLEIKGT